MTLKQYQESPIGATGINAARRPQTTAVPPRSLRALCCDGSRHAGEGAAEAQSPCAALAEPAAVQARSY